MRDADAYQAEEALRRYGDMIFRLAFSYLGNTADAEDVVQNTMIQLLYKSPEFESDEHKKAWILRVAINFCKNILKSSWRRKREDFPAELPGKELTQEEGDVWQAVNSLSPKYRAVIHLYYYEGYSTAQIAAATGTNENTVRSRMARARKELKKALKGAYDFA